MRANIELYRQGNQRQGLQSVPYGTKVRVELLRRGAQKVSSSC